MIFLEIYTLITGPPETSIYIKIETSSLESSLVSCSCCQLHDRMSASTSSSTPFEPRRSERETNRQNRFFTPENAKDFLIRHSVFPKFIAQGDMIRLLREVQKSVDQMPLSDPSFKTSTTVACHLSATMHSFDLDKSSDELQHLADHTFEMEHRWNTQVKRSNDTKLDPSPKSIAEINACYTADPDGLCVCCFNEYSSLVTYPEPFYVKAYPYADSCGKDALLTKGGFFTHLHVDEGATTRYSQLVNRGCAKLWIFIRSLTLHEAIKGWKHEWQVSLSTFSSSLSFQLHFFPISFPPPSPSPLSLERYPKVRSR